MADPEAPYLQAVRLFGQQPRRASHTDPAGGRKRQLPNSIVRNPTETQPAASAAIPSPCEAVEPSAPQLLRRPASDQRDSPTRVKNLPCVIASECDG